MAYRKTSRQLKGLFIEAIFLIICEVVIGFPVSKPDFEIKPELKDEKYYPNGTVVGKYIYNDKEGNPIHVKYYADDSSYGVELKSIKIIDSSSETTLFPKKVEYETKAFEPPLKIVPVEMNNKYRKDSTKYKENQQNNYIDDVARVNRLNLTKPTSDYEVYYQNELKSPKKYDKDKIRLYLKEKEKRKTRNSVNDYVIPKFCDMFW